MARRETLLDILDRLAPDVRDAFVQSIARVTGQAQMRAMEDAIARGDVSAVLQMLDLDRSYFAPLDRAFSDAYVQAGDWTMEELARQAKAQGVRVAGYFDGRNIRAERFLADQSARFVTEIADDVRGTVRGALSAALERGTAPRTTALDLVGRINRATGLREGGLIGLTTGHAGWADNALDELLSGDPAALRNYLGRKLRDRRFDKLVIRAIQDGKPLGRADTHRIVARYRQRLLKMRGDTIARTELLGSLHHAQNEGLQQMVDSGKARADAIRREWDASEDSATRLSHRALDGETVTGPDGVFTTINGARLRYPGDTRLGAPASEVVNCRCQIRTRIDFTKGLRDRLTGDELAAVREAMAG